MKTIEEMLKESVDFEQGIYSAIGSQGKLKSMIGAKDFVRSAKGLTFKLARTAKSINMITIELNGKDTYDVKFAKFTLSKAEYKLIKEEKDVLGEQLKAVIEKTTGLHLSL